MKLGIIGAMDVEVATLKEKMENCAQRELAGSVFWEGTLLGLPAVVVQCGVGKVNAALCVQVLADCFGITHVVNTGIAGSLTPELDIGDLVVSTQAIYHDFDCHLIDPDYPVGQVPDMDVRAFPGDGMLVDLAYQAAEAENPGHCLKGTVASGDQFVCQKSQKEKIVEDTGAVCTEMEGAAIAHAAWKNRIPFVVIRAISDKADDSAQMDYPTFESIAAVRCANVTLRLAEILKHKG